MRRIVREMAHDLKEMGVHMWMIPLVSLVFLVMTFFVQKSLDAVGKQNLFTLSVLEILIPSLGGYGALMLMQGLLDTEGCELSFSYSRTNLYWGLIRQFRFFILFALLIAVVCKVVSIIMQISFAPIFFLTLMQSFAVMGVSFLGITLGKKVSIGLVFLIAFVGIQITIGREYAVFNRIYLLNGIEPSYEQCYSIFYDALFIGVFGWGIGQLWVRP